MDAPEYPRPGLDAPQYPQAPPHPAPNHALPHPGPQAPPYPATSTPQVAHAPARTRSTRPSNAP
ncbi:hypothetical protein GA0115245_10484, partial [Streptomyces sp. di188]